MQTVAVVAATGGIGRHVVRHALSQNFKVRALARDPQKLRTILSDIGIKFDDDEVKEKLDIIQGDVTNVDSLKSLIYDAKDEISLVISCVGNVSGNKGKVVEVGTRNLIQVIEEIKDMKKPRLCYVSSVGCNDSYHQMKKLSWVFANVMKPFVLKSTFIDLEKAEKVALDKDFVIIARPPGLSDGSETGKFKLVDEKETNVGSKSNMSRKDVALAMLSFVGNNDWDGKPVTILPKMA